MSGSEHNQQAIAEVAPRPRSRLLQWDIATLLFLMAAVAVWTSYFRMKSETTRMVAELDSLRQLARELIVNDPNQYAIVERHEEWYDDHVWDVHIPEGSRYLLKLATREIGMKLWVRGVPKDDFPDTDHFVKLSAGRHVISLEKTLSGDELSVRAIVDGKLAVKVPETNDWKPAGSYSSSGSFHRSTQAPADQPLELIRVRFYKKLANGRSMPSDEPYNGALLWIERE